MSDDRVCRTSDLELVINKENNATTLLLFYNISIIFQKGLSTDCQVQMKVPYGHVGTSKSKPPNQEGNEEGRNNDDKM